MHEPIYATVPGYLDLATVHCSWGDYLL